MRSDDVRSHLDAVILAALEQGPLHGYAVIETLRLRSGGALDLPTGTIYPALRRLENSRWVSSRWSTVNGRNRRTYHLTRAGRHALAGRRSDWRQLQQVIDGLLGGGPRAAPTP